MKNDKESRLYRRPLSPTSREVVAKLSHPSEILALKNIALICFTRRLGSPIFDSATRQPGNLATPDHETLVKHLYAVQHYTEIFDLATRQPGNPATREHTTLLNSLYMRLGDPVTRRPGNLATPDHATLAKHLYAVQHYTNAHLKTNTEHFYYASSESKNQLYIFLFL